MRYAIAVLLVPLFLTIGACVTPRLVVETPQGFAALRDLSNSEFVSPEGMKIRVRLVKNDPSQDAEFWSRALERHMRDAGYLLVGTGEFNHSPENGTWFEWLAPVRGSDWIYLQAVLVENEHIVILEAAGPSETFDLYRDTIRASLVTIHIGTRR